LMVCESPILMSASVILPSGCAKGLRGDSVRCATGGYRGHPEKDGNRQAQPKPSRHTSTPPSEFEALNGTLLFRCYERARCSYTLPCTNSRNPSIDESFAVDVWFASLRALDSKHPDDDSDIPINLDIALLGDCLGWLIVRRLDTREKFAL